MRKRETLLEQWRTHRPVIAPSMLKCDFGNLKREIALLEAAGTQVFHLDVMDGHFVPNLSYGPMVIERMRDLTQVPFDAHLMISDPATYLDDYLRAGCDAITVHLEAVANPSAILRTIRESGCIAGLAINPQTPMEAAGAYLPDCDLLLVMSVEPGFGGQTFIPDVLTKVAQARQAAGDRLLISIDGGINPQTIGAAAAAGSDLFVAGSSVFDQPDYTEAMCDLHRIAATSVTAHQGTTTAWQR